MESYIVLAEQQGCHILAEAVYVGADILSPTLDAEPAQDVYRAITQAVDLITADPWRYFHHLITDLPPEWPPLLSPADIHFPRLWYVAPRPYPAEAFKRTYRWIRSWELIADGVSDDQPWSIGSEQWDGWASRPALHPVPSGCGPVAVAWWRTMNDI
jgi:NitT/TauT family transport system substrate-binding protein